jgi:predicted SprT family Zn-dependent metalloprotease
MPTAVRIGSKLELKNNSTENPNSSLLVEIHEVTMNGVSADIIMNTDLKNIVSYNLCHFHVVGTTTGTPNLASRFFSLQSGVATIKLSVDHGGTEEQEPAPNGYKFKVMLFGF